MSQALGSYDLVMALSQQALNDQFQLVFPDGQGIQPWNAQLASDGSAVAGVTFGTPSVNLSTPFTRGAALNLPVTAGSYTYWTVQMQNGKPTPIQQSQALAGTTITVTASLQKFHDTSYQSADFTMQRVFLDLTDPNLDVAFTIGLQGQALVSLTTLFTDYLTQLNQQNSASFLFGSVKVPTVPADTGPLAPRAFDFSVNCQASNPGNNTLNFLLMVDTDVLPTGPGVGVLANNLVTPGNDGAFFVSDYQLLSKFVLPSVIAGIQANDPGTQFGASSFAYVQTPAAKASLTGNVNYEGGWFSKFDIYVANGEVTMDIEYRKTKQVIIDSVTGVGDVSAFITIYTDSGALAYKTSQTQPQVHSEGSSVVWRVFQDIFTLGFAEIGEKVVGDAVQSAVKDFLSPGNLSTAINSTIALVELPAPTLFAYTGASLPADLEIDVTMKSQGPAPASGAARDQRPLVASH